MTAFPELPARRRIRAEKLLVEAWFRKMGRDFGTFAQTCVQVPNPRSDRGRVPLELYDYQDETVAGWASSRFSVVLKARQLGLTTIVMAFFLHELMHRPGSNILLVSKDQETANKALDLLKFMWRFLPDWYRQRAPRLNEDSATEMVWVFDDGMESRIVSRPATKTAGAGETVTWVGWDEAALAKYQEDTQRTLTPTTDAGGSMIVFSTARGAHNTFAQLYRRAERGDSRFKPMFHPWFVSRLMNPKAHLVRGCGDCRGKGLGGAGTGRFCGSCVDTQHYDAAKKEFADEPWRFFAEYPSTPEEAFRESGRSRFGSLPPIDEFEELGWRGKLLNGELVEDEFGPLRLSPEWLQGAPQWAKVVMAVDPSSGVGGDYHAITIGWLDQNGVPVRAGFWHDNTTEPIDVAKVADQLGRYFHGSARAAHLAVEKAGGWGDTVINELHRNLGYPNLYLHRTTGHRKRKTETTFGFPMTSTRRPLVIDKLAAWLPSTDDPEKTCMQGIDPLLRHELGAFVVKDNGRVEADVGMHDDLVMSTAIWAFVLEEVGAPATNGPKGETPSSRVFRIDVSHIWEEAEKAIAAHERASRREGRTLARELRGRR